MPGGGARRARARARAVTEYHMVMVYGTDLYRLLLPKPKIIVIGTTVWRQEFDRMVVMPVIAVVGLVLAFAFAVLYFKSFSCNSVTDEEVRQKAPRRSHQHHSQHHGNKKRRISTRRCAHSHKDVPIERPVVQQFDQRYYCYFRFSGVRQFLSAMKQFISYPISTLSFLIPWYEQESNTRHHGSWHATTPSTILEPSSTQHSNSTMENFFHDAIVVGLDCEMVGGGRGGWRSLLARCSVVTLDHVPTNNSTSACTEKTDKIVSSSTGSEQNEMGQQQNFNRLDENLIVLYDKYIIPKGKITDYRTEWSGITKDTYSQSQQSPLPIVSFNQCQNEITQLFSSIQGRKVIVVGHALENDFEALEINVSSFSFASIILYYHADTPH